jgi:hypothetical protein
VYRLGQWLRNHVRFLCGIGRVDICEWGGTNGRKRTRILSVKGDSGFGADFFL